MQPLCHVNAVSNTVAVCQDDGRAGIILCLAHRQQCLLWIATHRDTCHVDVTVGDGLQCQILLAHCLTGRCKLGGCSDGC